MLNAQVAYLEHIAGPAWRVDGKYRTYKVSGCIVDVVAESNAVRSLGLRLNDRCTFDPSLFLGIKLPSANKMTFGDLDRAWGGGRFYADCLYLCGNAYDPSVYEHFDGPHAANFIEVNVEAALVSRASVAASEKWQAAIQADRSQDFVMKTQFNCTTSFDQAAHSFFRNIKLTELTVGYDLELPGCSQK